MPPESISPEYPSLTPITSAWMEETVKNCALLNDLFDQYGSPIHLHHGGSFARNYRAYQAVLKNYGLEHKIYFARKANRCRIYVDKAANVGMGVDTASYRELKQCLDLGCAPDDLVLTAAVKDEQLVRLALRHRVLIIVDNEDECRFINQLAEELDKTPTVGLRLSGFYNEGQKLYSRFGFDIETITSFLTGPFCTRFKNLHFGGFHFHLDGYSIKQRSRAVAQIIHKADLLKKEGISTSFIDMGGGLLVNYLSDQGEWNHFWRELRQAVCGDRPALTFGNDGLGYEMIDGKLRKRPAVYPFFNDMPKEQFLEAVLSFQTESGASVATLLDDREIELRMQPGRSLLDQAGMSLAKVAHRKKDHRGNWLVGLQMNRSQMFSSSADFLIDPIYIPMGSHKSNKEPVPVYFTGGFCLEQDVILKRKIMLPRLPQRGDVIAFPNTAGYMMHFYETESHLFPKAANVVIDEKTTQNYRK